MHYTLYLENRVGGVGFYLQAYFICLYCSGSWNSAVMKKGNSSINQTLSLQHLWYNIVMLINHCFLFFLSSMAFYLDCALNCTRVLMRAVSGWIPRHCVGALLVSLPAVTVFSHVTCDMSLSIQVDFQFIFQLKVCHKGTSIAVWLLSEFFSLIQILYSGHKFCFWPIQQLSSRATMLLKFASLRYY